MYKIKGLIKSYEIDNKKINVINNLDLEIDPTAITVIIGKSGCGKTTLLRILCGLEKYDDGIIDLPSFSKLSMVFQEPNLMPWLTVTKNIEFGLKKEEINKEKTEKLIGLVGLEGFENAYPWQLSGGMKRRVSLARALISNPDMLLLDEPFASLDYFIRSTMQKELLRIHEETKMGGIFVTHNIDEAILLGDSICVMKNGVISKRFDNIPKTEKEGIYSRETAELKKEILASLE